MASFGGFFAIEMSSVVDGYMWWESYAFAILTTIWGLGFILNEVRRGSML